MATVWDAVDPTDVVDLWFDFVAIVSPDLTILTASVTAPPEVTLVGGGAVDGLKVRIRQGPTPVGKHLVGCHITLSNGEERDMEARLTIRERIVR